MEEAWSFIIREVTLRLLRGQKEDRITLKSQRGLRQYDPRTHSLKKAVGDFL